LPTIVIPDGVPSIGERAFYECSNLTSIKLPENLSSIGTYAFYQCYDLQSVVIPEGVTTIGSYAFSNCTYLTSVTLPSTLTSIGDHAFYGSIRLTEVINHSGFSLTCGSDEYGYVAAYAMEIHQGESKIDNQEGYLFYPYGGINYLIAYIGSDTNLTLPQSYRGEAYEITSVTFFGCTHLTSITIPNGTITRIPDPMTIHSEGFISVPFGAFVGCNSLTNISIGNGVTSIGMCAFYSCTSLTSITIPDSVTTIGDGAFYNCSSLTSIWIGKGVTSIGESVFFKCVALTDIQVHQDNPSYQSIDGHLYTKDGTTLIKYAVGNAQTSFVVPDSVTSIIGGAFDGNETLASITLPFVGATKDGTENTKFMYIFGNSVPSSLKTVIITGGTTIAAEAFYNCYTLTSITIPHTVTSIGAGAFSGCSSLESITLPFIGSSVTVEIDSPNAQFGYVFGETTSGTTQHYKPSSGGYAYAKTYRIPSTLKSVTVLGGSLSYCAFENCINLTTVTLGDAVTSIGNLAFKNCSNLTSVTIGNGVTSIGDDAFYGCGGLTSITIPDSVTSIGSSAFYNCSSLTSVTIGKGVISDNLNFSSCGNLTSITVDPNNTVYQSIDGNLYTKDGTTLIRYAVGKTATTFVIPDSVTSIGASAFATCSSLTSITIPDGVTIIGTSAFANCSSLTSITIPSGVTGIGASTFANCSSLTSITIPDSVTAIGNQAFSGCGNLTSVVIGKNVKQIGRYAFEMCYNLTSVSFENNFWRWYVTQTPPLNTTYDTAIRQDALKISSTAAKYLWSNYCNYYWIRND